MRGLQRHYPCSIQKGLQLSCVERIEFGPSTQTGKLTKQCKKVAKPRVMLAMYLILRRVTCRSFETLVGHYRGGEEGCRPPKWCE